MLRSGVQFEITNQLQHLKNNDDIVSFLNVLGTELKVNNINSLLIKIFINIKRQLNDESLHTILKWLNRQTNCMESKSQCQLNKIPNDVFYHIGSYLSYFDTIKLSQTNHLFHKKIHNKSFIDSSNNVTQNALNFSERRMSTICKMGTNYANLSYNKWNRLVIGDEIEENSTIHCSKCNQCPFCQIISQIDEYNNYDLQWFANILSNVKIINLSNNWPCLWNKMPLKWLLNSDNETPLSVAATRKIRINNKNGRAFVDHYESYFVNQCESDLNKIRQIGRIYFGSSIDYCYPKMNENYTMLLMERGETFKCQTLSQFLKMFHQNVKRLVSLFTEETDLCGIFFDSSSDIYKDINKNQSIVSLQSFISKYNIDPSILPRIENMELVLYTWTIDACAKLLQFFQDSKLMTILNVETSLKRLCIKMVDLHKDFHICYDTLIDTFNVIIDNFFQIEYIDIAVSHKNKEAVYASPSGNHVFLDKMQSLFEQLYFEPVLYKILYNLKSNSNDKSSKNLKQITIGWDHRHDKKRNQCIIATTVEIDNIQSPFNHSCKQRSKSVCKQILKRIENEKEKQIKLKPNCHDLSIQLIIKFETERKL